MSRPLFDIDIRLDYCYNNKIIPCVGMVVTGVVRGIAVRRAFDFQKEVSSITTEIVSVRYEITCGPVIKQITNMFAHNFDENIAKGQRLYFSCRREEIGISKAGRESFRLEPIRITAMSKLPFGLALNLHVMIKDDVAHYVNLEVFYDPYHRRGHFELHDHELDVLNR